MARIGWLAACLTSTSLAASLAFGAEPPGVDRGVPMIDEPQVILNGQTLFDQRCLNCHAKVAGQIVFAPSLFGVVGRKAGSAEGYSYSPRFAGSDLTWTREALSSFLASATTATPSIFMRHVGVADLDERKAVLDYLDTLK